MRYASIDCETTGRNPKKHQIIQLAVVVAETSGEILGKAMWYVYHDELIGEPYALWMNAKIIDYLRCVEKYLDVLATNDVVTKDKTTVDPEETVEESVARTVLRPYQIGERLYNFLSQYFDMSKPITVAGKNFAGFDKPFLENVGALNAIKLHYRVLDLGNLFFDPDKDDPLPSSDECLKRAGINKKCEHDALSDALDVVNCITAWANKQRAIKNDLVIAAMHTGRVQM